MSTPATIPGLNLPPWSLVLDRAVMGIDPSTKRMSAAVIYPASERWTKTDAAFEVSTLSLPQATGDESRRLALQQTAMVPWLTGLLTTWNPERVVVETPFAGTIGGAVRVPAESFHVIGILLAVLGQHGVRVDRMGPSSWKSYALGAGQGNARKPPMKCPKGSTHAWDRDPAPLSPVECLKCGITYAVLSWARAAGYEGVLYDEADALGLATAGGVLLERERRATE